MHLVRILPLPEKYDTYDFTQFDGVNIDNIKSISNLIGNLTLSKYVENDSFNLDNFSKRANELIENQKYFLLDNYILNKSFPSWGLDNIEKRSNEFMKIAMSVFINGDFDVSFFDKKYYYIELGKNRNAVMLPMDGKCKVLKNSMCNSNEVLYEWSHGELKDELLKSKILINDIDGLKFSSDYIFDSSSAAASIITARQAPGPITWKDIHGNDLKNSKL